MSDERGARAVRGRTPRANGGLPAWLAMLHALGDPAWIVDARDLTLAGINRSALELLALSEADLSAVVPCP